jgi:hypothetical protein
MELDPERKEDVLPDARGREKKRSGRWVAFEIEMVNRSISKK